MNHVLRGVQIPHGKGQFWGGRRTTVKYRDTLWSSVQTRLNWSRTRGAFGLWARMSPRNRVLDGCPDPPREGAILVDRGAHCEVWALSVVSCAKTAKPIDCRLDCGLEWAEAAHFQSYSPGGANVPSWEDTLPSPGEYDWITRLQRRCALCQITSTTCYLWTRALRQSHR